MTRISIPRSGESDQNINIGSGSVLVQNFEAIAFWANGRLYTVFLDEKAGCLELRRGREVLYEEEWGE